LRRSNVGKENMASKDKHDRKKASSIAPVEAHHNGVGKPDEESKDKHRKKANSISLLEGHHSVVGKPDEESKDNHDMELSDYTALRKGHRSRSDDGKSDSTALLEGHDGNVGNLRKSTKKHEEKLVSQVQHFTLSDAKFRLPEGVTLVHCLVGSLCLLCCLGCCTELALRGTDRTRSAARRRNSEFIDVECKQSGTKRAKFNAARGRTVSKIGEITRGLKEQFGRKNESTGSTGEWVDWAAKEDEASSAANSQSMA